MNGAPWKEICSVRRRSLRCHDESSQKMLCQALLMSNLQLPALLSSNHALPAGTCPHLQHCCSACLAALGTELVTCPTSILPIAHARTTSCPAAACICKACMFCRYSQTCLKQVGMILKGMTFPFLNEASSGCMAVQKFSTGLKQVGLH